MLTDIAARLEQLEAKSFQLTEDFRVFNYELITRLAKLEKDEILNLVDLAKAYGLIESEDL